MGTTRFNFHQQLDALQEDLQAMGNRVVEAVQKGVRSLTERDLALAEAVVEGDKEINRLHLHIEQSCINLLALQQPLARDLRLISTAWKMVTDLERIGDHAVDIAKASLRLGEAPLAKPLVDLPKMAELAIGMVRDALDAFAAQDPHQAEAMVAADHQVDSLHARIIADLSVLMQEYPETIHSASQLMFVSGALERIGDHATNLGEWVIYLATGEYRELNT